MSTLPRAYVLLSPRSPARPSCCHTYYALFLSEARYLVLSISRPSLHIATLDTKRPHLLLQSSSTNSDKHANFTKYDTSPPTSTNKNNMTENGLYSDAHQTGRHLPDILHDDYVLHRKRIHQHPCELGATISVAMRAPHIQPWLPLVLLVRPWWANSFYVAHSSLNGKLRVVCP